MRKPATITIVLKFKCEDGYDDLYDGIEWDWQSVIDEMARGITADTVISLHAVYDETGRLHKFKVTKQRGKDERYPYTPV